ncbi:MAG: glycosyltransferase family 2 protein [Solirubrobacteraceae bacterium]|nr:glycosyltransferase family 2 protein [Solirubrobacteraceae bacterium]
MFTCVVVLHDSEADIVRLLGSIDRHLPDRPQVICVDTDSTDAGAARAEAWGAEVVRLGDNPGFGAANNIGVDRATHPVTALLNPDCELHDDGLARLASLAAGRDALLAPRLLNTDGSTQRSAHPPPGGADALVPALIHPRVLPRPLRERFDPWRAAQPRLVGWAIAACLVARTSLLRRVGPFDPAHFLFAEDLDLCLRAAAAGSPTELHPAVALTHHGATSTTAAYDGEPFTLVAAQRRRVIGAALGPRALARDDTAQALTFRTRAAARTLVGRDATRERAQLAALRAARALSAVESPAGHPDGPQGRTPA